MGKDMPGNARRHSEVSYVQKWLNWSRCRLGCGLGCGSKEACVT